MSHRPTKIFFFFHITYSVVSVRTSHARYPPIRLPGLIKAPTAPDGHSPLHTKEETTTGPPATRPLLSEETRQFSFLRQPSLHPHVLPFLKTPWRTFLCEKPRAQFHIDEYPSFSCPKYPGGTSNFECPFLSIRGYLTLQNLHQKLGLAKSCEIFPSPKLYGDHV